MYQIGDEELSEIALLFKSKKLFRYQGKNVLSQCQLLEGEFSDYINNPFSLFVTSGTNAIFLALKALGVGKGDEVIVPSYTFVATITAVIHSGAVPVCVSVGKGLTIDPDDIKRMINERTKAIIPVHMDGFACDMDAIMSIAHENKLKVIEDVAQAIGGEYKGRKLGSIGDAGCFSFNVDKIISCGEGGMVTFKNESAYKVALQLHDAPVSFGSTFKDYLADLSPVAGHSMRMSEISAVIMRQQLKRLDGIIGELKKRKTLMLNALVDLTSSLLLPSDTVGDCSTHIHLKFSNPLTAGDLARALTQKNILTMPLYTRPAHCFWHWQHLLETGVEHLSKDRPHLSNIIRIAVDFDLPEEELKNKVSLLGEIIKKC